jgi:hypothetical protein
MKKETLYELQIYYGELLQELQGSNDYFKNVRIRKKIKSIECLLDIDYLT